MCTSGKTRGTLGTLYWHKLWHTAVQCSAVQCSAVQCSAVQCSAWQCSAVQCSAVQCSVLFLCHTLFLEREIPIVGDWEHFSGS